eukprot:SAG11_NODE_7012_length_1208_cov_56.130748_2_plen_116_part_00
MSNGSAPPRQLPTKMAVSATAKVAELAEGPQGGEAEGLRVASTRVAVRALMLCCLCRNFGIMIRMQTETQMWLNAFAGDYAAQATTQVHEPARRTQRHPSPLQRCQRGRGTASAP